MKLTIKATDYPVVPVGKWTFEEADEVYRITQLRAGQVLSGLMLGNQNADLAFATVAYLRAGKNPDELRTMTLEEIEFDPSDDEQEESDSPPAVGAADETESGAGN